MSIRVGCVGAGFFSQFHLAGWRAIEGAQLQSTCSFQVAALDDVSVDVSWRLDGSTLRGGSRFRISVQSFVGVEGTVYSTQLTFDPVKSSDSGQFLRFTFSN